MESLQSSKPPKVDETGFSLLRLKELIDLNYITDFGKVNEPVYRSILIEVLIHTSHLLKYLETHYKDPITFTDDIPPSGDIENVTDLIVYFRNAACHDISPFRETNEWKSEIKSVAFAFVVGNGQYLNYPIFGKYEDDAMVLMGTKHLYIKRHLIRAYKELITKYLSKSDFNLYKVYFKL